MAWNPNPSNSVTFRGGNYALLFQPDPDFPQYTNTVLLSRPSPAVDWASFYNIPTGNWTQSVQQHGGWDGWIKWFVDEANTGVHLNLGDPSPIPPVTIPPGVPATFAECQAWLVQWLYFVDTPTTSNAYLGPKPIPPSGGFVVNHALDFGKQRVVLSLAVDENNKATMRAQRWVGPGANDWQSVPFDNKG